MNNDRELLELAAKAAGIDLRRLPDAWPTRFDDDQWNPMIDDGDAFRLASALHLTVEFGNNMVIHPNEVIGEGMEPLAATRRAIVRAAAEIGSAMP